MYNHDFVKLYQFFEKSDLVRKLNGYIQSKAEKANEEVKGSFSKSVLYEAREFVRVLSLNPDDGKLILEQHKLSYICLNATTTLKRIMDQVKAVIFISGTLEPS